MSWVAISFKTGFAIFGLSEVIHLLTGYNIVFTGIVITVVFAVLNIIGIKITSFVDRIFVALLFIVMIGYSVMSLPYFNINYFEPFAANGINSIFSTAAFVFISFGGLLKISSVAEEIANPKKNIPLGLFAALIVTTIIYTTVTFILVGTAPASKISNSLTPMADSAGQLFGENGFLIITLASVLAFLTTIIAGIMSASRYPFALSKDNLFPSFVGRVSKSFNTPVVSILITSGLIIISLFFSLDHLVKAASTIMMTTCVLSNIAVIILRESGMHNYRPGFKAPFYPVLQLLSIILFIGMIVDLGYSSINISLFFVFLSISIYFVYGAKKAKKTYALLHLIERITNKEITSTFLESELRDILRHRDNMKIDKFDRMIKKAELLELEESINLTDLINILIKHISSLGYKNIQINQTDIEDSAITGFVAVPHLVVEGDKPFSIIIIR
ncbi:MAG: amino acid permease [bacterium]|nr:amino acid permease [bacterium]